ncbi:MAG TPA: D-alanyl-D-alanine carboxypeptidase [Firmicutes bacterium]|nr:D-alanyl-D-alanine carboxypeptidase [Bacillota bacterium]
MPTYAAILEDTDSVTYAIQFGLYPNVKTNFYGDIVTLTNPESTLALVNKNYALPTDYEPTDLVYLENISLYAPGRNNEANYLRAIAAEALTEMFEVAKQEQGYTLIARSGYRSYETQVGLYSHYVQTNGQWYADAYSARAGHSEHQTGLTIDVTSRSVSSGLSATFGTSTEGQWVAQNCHRFGFIIRYPEGRSEEVGYEYEPWHLRYVGIEAATEIYENNSILEDYLLEHALIENQ